MKCKSLQLILELHIGNVDFSFLFVVISGMGTEGVDEIRYLFCLKLRWPHGLTDHTKVTLSNIFFRASKAVRRNYPNTEGTIDGFVARVGREQGFA